MTFSPPNQPERRFFEGFRGAFGYGGDTFVLENAFLKN
jgi:hypothetical protein